MRFTPAACALALTAFVGPLHAQQLDPAGNWSVKGADPSGKAYAVKLTVAKVKSAFRLDYKEKGGRTAGAGFMLGNFFVTTDGDKDCIVSAYKVAADGKMTGSWAAGDGTSGPENMSPQGTPKGVAGKYEMAGKDEKGVPFAGLVTIDPRGQIFKVTGESGGEKLDGVGILQGDIFAASWGGAKCGVSIFELKADNTYSGIWGAWGESKLGKEEAVKGW